MFVSGDGDFLAIVKNVKELNKYVEVWVFRYSLANELNEDLEQENI